MISNLLEIKKGITSIIGGGGKTTLMHTLARELSDFGSVIITTTTHIMKSDVYPTVVTEDGVDNTLNITKSLNNNNCICVGSVCCGDKLSAPALSINELSTLCDYLLVEADGSKHMPLKAHLDNEPVIPIDSNQTILVVGVDAIGQRLCDVTHRYEKACEILSCDESELVTDCLVSELIATENLHDKVVINKCDDENSMAVAQALSKKIHSKCIIASLHKGEWYVSSN